MSTSAITSTTGSTTPATGVNSKMNLNTDDFINLMVTELQNQDPMQPASNEQLLAQMSQIGQLQSAQSLQSAMSSMMAQTKIASASGLIGKTITGQDDQQNPVKGVVTGVSVNQDKVTLQLDTGDTLDLQNVQTIEGAPIQRTTTGSLLTNAINTLTGKAPA